jgi:hypothetical protein
LLRLLGSSRFQGTGNQSAHRFDSDILHGGQIDIEPRPLLAEGPPADNFSPLLGEIVQFAQLLLSELDFGHEKFLLELMSKVRKQFPVAMLTKALCFAKQFLHPPSSARGCCGRLKQPINIE